MASKSKRGKSKLTIVILLALLFGGLGLTLLYRRLLVRPQIALIDSAPTPGRYLTPVFTDYTFQKDLVYGTSAGINSPASQVSLKLDVYQPVGDTATSRPAIVWIHGGGFVSGDKSDFNESQRGFAPDYTKLGYVNFAINYRLLKSEEEELGDGISAAKADALKAIAWIKAHATEYKVDPGKIVAAGISAGAVTSLYVGYTSSGNPGLPAAVVSISGTMQNPTAIPLDPLGPPSIFLHGTKDITTSYAGAQQIYNRLLGLGVKSEFHSFEGKGHTVAPFPEIHPLIQQFLYQNLILGLNTQVQTAPTLPVSSPTSAPDSSDNSPDNKDSNSRRDRILEWYRNNRNN